MVKANSTIIDTLKEINQLSVRGTVVEDENRKIIGFITNGDISRGLINGLTLFDNIESIYNKKFIYLYEDEASNEKIRETLEQHQIFQIPILNRLDSLVEIVTMEKIFLSSEKKSKNIVKSTINGSKGTVLLIGGAGYIGTWLTKFLLEDGYSVKTYDKFMFGTDVISEFIDHKNYSYINADTNDLQELLLAHLNVDAVIHLAGVVGDPASRLDTKLTIIANYISTAAIASLCHYLKVPKMILASTCSVYGQGEEIFTEQSPIKPLSPYAYTKYESENVLLSFKSSFFSPTILRFGTIFGISKRPRFDLVINLLTAKAVRGEPIEIFGGTQHRPFIHVSDVARAVKLVLEAPDDKVKGEIINVGDDRLNIQFSELAPIFEKFFPNIDLSINTEENDPRDYRVSFKKIRNLLNFEAKITIEEGVKEIKEFLAINPNLDYKSPIYNNKDQLEEIINTIKSIEY